MKQRSALATTMHLRDNLRAVFNHTDGNASPKHILANTAAPAVFLCSYHAKVAPSLWLAMAGSLRAAGSKMPVFHTLP